MKVISIVGHDGAGKTSVAEEVIKKLKSKGYLVGALKINPFKGEIYMANRESLQCLEQENTIQYNFMFELIVAYETLLAICSCLNETSYDYLICDRYVETMEAYLKVKHIGGNLYTNILGDTPKPNLIVYLEVSNETIKERMGIRGDIFCDLEYDVNQKVMDTLRQYPCFRAVNGQSSVHDISESIIHTIMEG